MMQKGTTSYSVNSLNVILPKQLVDLLRLDKHYLSITTHGNPISGMLMLQQRLANCTPAGRINFIGISN